ncbi:hypothetical protein BerOc1_00067 [Pseudodesulfovibrio hydrargyri]|uniref:SMODS and SLOG-associating 2TM effector domain-containing protein n=1 Tax=Pseudodesulfovibrio hydrargyri TaxID=2125990 RepID=A0A1J5N0H5_9BACT|nr:hypothetical protein [Pseudodesulfovibrio hydrargyri]OIQ51612.1 hypothetical protein BerOc1_00067 [Pseudodesulfovibrio hydrargyri]
MGLDKNTNAVISEPFVELTIQAMKARRSLLLCSLIVCARISGISIEGPITVMQTTLTGITPEKLDWLLLGGILYFFIMLIVHGFESFQKWKLRLTGPTQQEFIESLGDILAIPNDPQYGVAYKIFRRLINDLEEQTAQPVEGAYPPTKLKTLHQTFATYSDKLELLEKKFWRHQLTLVLRFAILDYFGPLLFALATGGYFLVQIIRSSS